MAAGIVTITTGGPAIDLCNFEDLLTPEEKIRDRVRGFCDREVMPVINDFWERAEFPKQLVRGLGALGVVGGSISGYGCPAMSVVAEGLVAAECARADGSVIDTLAGHGLAMTAINLLGSDEQKQNLLPRMATMETIAAFGLTERDHGSDAGSLQTTAHSEGDSIVLNGEKRWITNGSVADVVLVWARGDNDRVGGYLVETPVEGLTREVMTGKTSCRAADHAVLRLQGVRVPRRNRLPGGNDFRDMSQTLVLSPTGSCVGSDGPRPGGV